MVHESNAPKLFWALKSSILNGYSANYLKADILAGIVVGISAVPLSMALAIASGVPPQNGLYTALIGGFLAALLGGSRHQVTGPTAAFVVLLLPVVIKFGLTGLLLAGLLSGIILLLLGLFKLGDAIKLIPHPVTTGFTAGIALVIACIQIKDFFGMSFTQIPEHFWDRIYLLIVNMGTTNFADLSIGVVTLLLIIFFSMKFKKVPAPIIALIIVTSIATLLPHFVSGMQFATIGNKFIGGIPQELPSLMLPWKKELFFLPSWKTIIDIAPSAFAIAMLGAIESLLSAAVAKGMTHQQFNPNSELLAQGVANIVVPFFGGIPATGAIARTGLGIRFGARSPITAMVHALFILLVLISLAPLANYLPMAAMAALLLFVAYNMAEKHHVRNILKVGSFEDKATLIACFSFTVLFDMTIGVAVGLILACILFIKRMTNLSYGKKMLIEREHYPHLEKLPTDIFYYQIGGPMFFGTAQKTISALSVDDTITKVIIDLSEVPMADMTGLAAIKSVLDDLRHEQKQIALIIRQGHFYDQLEKFYGQKGLAEMIKASTLGQVLAQLEIQVEGR